MILIGIGRGGKVHDVHRVEARAGSSRVNRPDFTCFWSAPSRGGNHGAVEVSLMNVKIVIVGWDGPVNLHLNNLAGIVAGINIEHKDVAIDSIDAGRLVG